MAVAAGDALLETPGASGFLQHFQIMIGFQHEDIGVANALKGEFGGVAEIGQKTDLAAGSAEHEADGIGSIMRNAECFDQDVADLKAAAGAEHAAVEFGLELEFDGFPGKPVAINGNVEFGTETDEAVDMVRVFVSDQDAGDAFGRAANGGEALPDLAAAETGVNEDTGLGGLQVGAIAAGTAAQNSQLNGHKGTVIGDGCGSNN